MKVRDVVDVLETVAPPDLAAEWDNVGLLIGDGEAVARKLMLCIDLTEDVLGEAIRAGAKMVMAYHPVIFKPVTCVTAADTPVPYAAARAGLAVYSMHTALDAAPGGTNDVLAGLLGLTDPQPIEPVTPGRQCKIVVFVPPENVSVVADAAFAEGAGRIGSYSECSFRCGGAGSFRGGGGARPAKGTAGRREQVEEVRVEMIAPRAKAARICSVIRSAHMYETPAIDVYPLEDLPGGAGMGRIGGLARPVSAAWLIRRIKKATGLDKLLVAGRRGRGGLQAKVQTAACCAGSCGSIFRAAAAGGAGFYLTGEMSHHDALAAAGAGMTVVCLGHSNSERMALKHLAGTLRPRLGKVSVLLSRRDKDPFEIR